MTTLTNVAREGYQCLQGVWNIHDPDVSEEHRRYARIEFHIDRAKATRWSWMKAYVRQTPGVLSLTRPGHSSQISGRGAAVGLLVRIIQIINYAAQSNTRAVSREMQLVGLGGDIYGRDGDTARAQRQWDFWNHDSRVQGFLGCLGFFEDRGELRWWESGAAMILGEGGWVYMIFRHQTSPYECVRCWFLKVGESSPTESYELRR